MKSRDLLVGRREPDGRDRREDPDPEAAEEDVILVMVEGIVCGESW